MGAGTVDYPRMLYRSGNSLKWEGLSLDTLVVDDEAEERAAIAKGWRANPLPLDHDQNNVSGGSKPRRKRVAK